MASERLVRATNAESGMNKSSKAKPKATAGDGMPPGVVEGISKVAIDDTPTAKSKNLDVLAEFGKLKKKKAANFVVIGW